jgi:hypothetical protein
MPTMECTAKPVEGEQWLFQQLIRPRAAWTRRDWIARLNRLAGVVGCTVELRDAYDRAIAYLKLSDDEGWKESERGV